MKLHPSLAAGLCAAALALGGLAGAQTRFERPPSMGSAGPRGGGGFERPSFRPGPMERDRPAPVERREGGGWGYGAPPPYARPEPYRPEPYRPDQDRPESGRPPGVARGWRAGPEPAPGLNAPHSASLAWVIGRLERRTPGRQLDAQVDYMDGRPVFRVMWLTTHGRRVDYWVDAQTGAILNER